MLPMARMADGPAAWWPALQAQGLDGLSAPELALAVHELARDQSAFVGLLAAANDYPRVPLCSVRRPEPADIEGLDRQLPRCRAVLLPAYELPTQARGGAAVLGQLPAWRGGGWPGRGRRQRARPRARWARPPGRRRG